MKRLFAILLCLAMSCGLMGCDGSGRLPSGSDPSTDTDITPEMLRERLADLDSGEAE